MDVVAASECSRHNAVSPSQPACLSLSSARSVGRTRTSRGTAGTMTFLSAVAVLTLVVITEGSVGLKGALLFITLALIGTGWAFVKYILPSTNGSFCTESKECLQFEMVCRTDEYEVRHYSPTRWVSTDAEAYFMGVGAAMAFRRLFQYITGANEAGVQMEMTAPVLVKIPEETKMWEPAVYTLNFPLPAAYQDKPPAPTNDKLYFTEMPEMDVYVRSYGGWMLSVTSRLHAHLLTRELGRVGAPYNHSYHYGVGYDSPLKLLNRHNEVWYVAEGAPVCTDPQEPTPAHTPRKPPNSPADLPSDPIPNSLSNSPALTNLSSSNSSDTANDVPTDTPTLLPSDSPPSPSSARFWARPTSGHPPTSAQASVDRDLATNATGLNSVAPSLEPQGVAALWNGTEHVLVDTQTGSSVNQQQDGV